MQIAQRKSVSRVEARKPDLMIAEVYGLVSGPAWWGVLFVKQFLDRGYAYVPMDSCALTLPGEEEGSPTTGLVVFGMDAVMEGGDEQHEAIMTDIATKTCFGPIKEVKQFNEGCCSTEGDGSMMEHFGASHSKSRITLRVGSGR